MRGELTGRHVLMMLIAFFGIIIAVNVDFIIKAETTFRGEDEHNPYLQGLDYNETLAKRAAQSELGWQALVTAARGQGRAADIRIDIQQKDGTAPRGLTLEGRLRHPSDANLDQTLIFRDAGEGHFTATLANVTGGLWNVEVHSTSEQPFEADRRIWLP